ncbi:MAG: energy transducer TonB [Acidobacteriota bacterium]
MFHASLIASQGRRETARLRLLSLAFAVHALLVAGVLLAQAWTVDWVPEPRIASTFVLFLPPPPPSAAPSPAARPAAARHAATAPIAVAAPAVQPHRVPETISPTLASPAPDSVPTIPGALPGTGDGPASGPGSGPGVGFGDGPGEAPVAIGEGIVAPALVRRVMPAYTEQARRAHLQGMVLLQAVIAADGTVAEVRLVRGLGFGLDENAIAAVRQWRYAPARQRSSGRALPVYLAVTVNYTLR